ncbi:hypothetical protein L9F63_008955 [Diploptera punctata]|uniref:Odorant receptor n=1 Tax=Diploptera punctata TaxID=6984 RepID=A0AAD8E119_DIPPU|nr:hypothetical protein L9F63_008955 [Diploptera punctata]
MYIIITQIALSGERGSEKQEDKNVVKYRFILEKMPIMIWIPFDVENDTTVFVTMYAAACLLGVIVSLVDISTDIANYALGTHLSAQFEILCAMLEDVEENVLVDNIFPT